MCVVVVVDDDDGVFVFVTVSVDRKSVFKSSLRMFDLSKQIQSVENI